MKKSNITKKHIKEVWNYSDLNIVHIDTPNFDENTCITIANIYAVSENDVMYMYTYFKTGTGKETIELTKVI